MLENIYVKDGSLLHICNNCNVTSLMWGEPSENGISIVSRFVTNETLDTKEYNIEKIVASVGTRVLMESGEYANYYGNGNFVDLSRDIGGYSSNDIKTVDVDFLITCIKDEDKIRALRNVKTNIDWSETEYAK